MLSAGARVSVVVVTRDRREELLASLEKLRTHSPGHPVVVVDNGSGDGSVAAVRARHPWVTVVALPHNLGCGGRTVGMSALSTPYVAFADDDSWWAEGALERAADLLDAHPRLAVLAARVLVGPQDRLDPVCAAMARSPLPRAADLPGPSVLGFLACGAVVRRHAYLEAGGFDSRLGIGGEETLLSVDLARRGWGLAYVDTVAAHHHPSPARDPRMRARREVRNALWTAWLRRPLPAALRQTGATLLRAQDRTAAWVGLLDASRGLPWVLRERSPVPAEVEGRLRLLEASGRP
jgi:GT2 family glycosyltransferase